MLMFLLRGNDTLLFCRLSGLEEFADKIHHDNQETKTADNS